MNIGLYQSAASLSALEKWQDSVAQNITSAQVNGYRQRSVSFTAVSGGEWDLSSKGEGDTSVEALFPKANSSINFTGGETQPTQRDLDVAIQGPGFFELQATDGSKSYTRNGQFSETAERTLVSGSGQVVLSEAGNPITLLPGGGKVTINQDGSIIQGQTNLGKISVQQFANPQDLTPVGGGMFVPKQGMDPTPVDKPDLLQGYLEASNVTPMREMVDMVLISRSYEANQKVIKTADDEMDKAIQELG